MNRSDMTESLILNEGFHQFKIQSGIDCKFLNGYELMRFFVQLQFDLFDDLTTIPSTSSSDHLNVFRKYANSFLCFHTLSILYPYSTRTLSAGKKCTCFLVK